MPAAHRLVRRRVASFAGLAFLACLPSLLPAQGPAPDISPFRAGQWGAEFGLGNFSSIGLLRFRTPQRALLFDVQGAVQRSSDSRGESEATTNTNLRLRVGARRYRAVTTNVQRFGTLGVFGQYSQSSTLSTSFNPYDPLPPVASQLRTRSLQAGLFAELGALWMVAPNLSLGFAWNAQAGYGRTETTLLDETRSSWGLSLGQIGVRGNFYF